MAKIAPRPSLLGIIEVERAIKAFPVGFIPAKIFKFKINFLMLNNKGENGIKIVFQGMKTRQMTILQDSARGLTEISNYKKKVKNAT